MKTNKTKNYFNIFILVTLFLSIFFVSFIYSKNINFVEKQTGFTNKGLESELSPSIVINPNPTIYLPEIVVYTPGEGIILELTDSNKDDSFSALNSQLSLTLIDSEGNSKPLTFSNMQDYGFLEIFQSAEILWDPSKDLIDGESYTLKIDLTLEDGRQASNSFPFTAKISTTNLENPQEELNFDELQTTSNPSVSAGCTPLSLDVKHLVGDTVDGTTLEFGPPNSATICPTSSPGNPKALGPGWSGVTSQTPNGVQFCFEVHGTVGLVNPPGTPTSQPTEPGSPSPPTAPVVDMSACKETQGIKANIKREFHSGRVLNYCWGYATAADELAHRSTPFPSNTLPVPGTLYPKLYCTSSATYANDGYDKPYNHFKTGKPVKAHEKPNIVHWIDVPATYADIVNQQGIPYGLKKLHSSYRFIASLTGTDGKKWTCTWDLDLFAHFSTAGVMTSHAELLTNKKCWAS